MSRHFLLSDGPLSLQGYIQHCNELVWPLFTHLETAVREGTNQHEKAFGKSSDNLFQVITILRSCHIPVTLVIIQQISLVPGEPQYGSFLFKLSRIS